MTVTDDVIADLLRQINDKKDDLDEYTRLPKPGPGNRYEGLARTTLLEIGERCPGLILTIRKKHAQRGIKLLHVPTLKRYLRSLRKGQEVCA